MSNKPAIRAYTELQQAYDFFNATLFADSLPDTLSTLVHEMCHVWQHHTPAKKCRGGYHDRVWGAKMEEIGLMPSNTGLPGGKKQANK